MKQITPAGLSAALASDCLDRLGLGGRVLAQRIAPLDRSFHLVGPAHTLETADQPGPVDDPYAGEIAAVDAITADSVVVVGTCSKAAIWGELLATRARFRGAVGIVSDCPVRDARQLSEMAFPTFCVGVSPLDAKGRVSVVAHGRSVICGGVLVAPGDLMVADADGAVAVPQEAIDDVLALAREKEGGEGTVRAALADGVSLRVIFEKHRIL